jgi:hypothetical protein
LGSKSCAGSNRREAHFPKVSMRGSDLTSWTCTTRSMGAAIVADAIESATCRRIRAAWSHSQSYNTGPISGRASRRVSWLLPRRSKRFLESLSEASHPVDLRCGACPCHRVPSPTVQTDFQVPASANNRLEFLRVRRAAFENFVRTETFHRLFATTFRHFCNFLRLLADSEVLRLSMFKSYNQDSR